MIAVAKPKKEADEAVRQLRQKAHKLSKTPNRKSLIRCRWYLLATSIPKKKMTSRELGKLYAQRWQVEIIFKAWKQSNHLEQSLSRKSGYQHLLGVFLSEVLLLSLSMHHYAKLRRKKRPRSNSLSIMKLFDWLDTQLTSATDFRCLLKPSPKIRLVSTQSRQRKFQLISMLELLG